jgi:shikimate dehydrogenase
MLKLVGTGDFAGVIGWPLEETLSPAIHNAAFRALHIDCAYYLWQVPPERLVEAVGGLRALSAVGANVTIPHKETVMEHLDVVSGDASEVGAVNTIQRVGDRLIGHNTDVDGFREFVAGDAGIDLAGKKVVVLGAGGAARAVVRASGDLKAAQVTVVARDIERAERLVSLASDVAVEGWDRASAAAMGADVIVNATPVGAKGDDPLPDHRWRPEQVALDLLYLPPITPFMERARAAGAESWGGLGMLVRQAAASFRIWTGQDPPLGAMSAAAVHAIGISGSTRPPALPT